jgi:hypothetical protein
MRLARKSTVNAVGGAGGQFVKSQERIKVRQAFATDNAFEPDIGAGMNRHGPDNTGDTSRAMLLGLCRHEHGRFRFRLAENALVR